jgi:hypothetical protein
LTQDRAGEPCLAAYYTGALDPAAVRRELRQHLPAAFLPAALMAVPRLPLTPNGKLDQAALPPAFHVRSAAKIDVAGMSPLQARIASAWGEVLGTESLALDANFFDLGGTSLSLLRVYRLLHGQPGLATLRVVDLFQHPTVRSLALFAEKGRPAREPSAAQARAEKQREAMARRRLLSTRETK